VPIRLHGFGESAVHPQFDHFIRYAEERGVNTCLSVNPIVLTPEISDRLLDAGPSLLFMSLDGHDDETFSQIRGLPHAYGRSKANLLRFLDCKRQRGITTKIVLSMIDFSLNDKSIGVAREYWSGIDGIDDIRIKPFCDWDGNATSVNQLIGINSNPAAAHSRTGPVVCQWPWTSVTILWDGSVVPCCFDFDKRYVLGNAGSESLQEIWQGPRLRALRREFITGDVTNSLCRNCSSLRA
jgi:radical SAM protein with 4Fe4S-binding SPASM domain